MTNFLAILIAGGGMLAIMGYGRVAFAAHSRSRRRAAIVIAVVTVLVCVPLAITGAQVARDSRLEFQIQSKAEAALGSGAVQLASVHATGDRVEVTLEGPPTVAARAAREVADRIHAAHPELDVRVFLLRSEYVEVRPG